MLHEFLTVNRVDLIARCREKVGRRLKRQDRPSATAHGVPLFLQQLADTLLLEQSAPGRGNGNGHADPIAAEISRAASLHGAELLRQGYSIDQVVRDYGDVCQSITELAVEQRALITTDEFRTLNRCLDDAIADAVTAFGQSPRTGAADKTEDPHRRLDAFADEQRRLLDIAVHSCAAIRTGSVGIAGATGTLLVHTLTELRSHLDRSLPDIRLGYAKTASAP
jgi:hypothetical protein